MTPEYCTLLFMRDGGQPLRFRMRFRRLCGICVLIALLFPLAVITFRLAWKWHATIDELQMQVHLLEQERDRISVELVRLAHLKDFLEMPDNAARLALRMQQTGAKEAEQLPEMPLQEQALETPAREAAGVATPTVDMSLVGVENVQARLLPGYKMRIAMDLRNPQQKNHLIGHVVCAVKNTQGDIMPLEIAQDVAELRLNNFKRAVFVSTLPSAMRNTNISVLVEIHLEERGLVYRNEFPAEH